MWFRKATPSGARTHMRFALTHYSRKVIVYFSEKEFERVQEILKDLGRDKDKNIILIDVRSDNKPSGSKA